MTGWIVLIVILAVLFLISLIRLGGRAKYGPEGFRFFVMAGPMTVQLIPAGRKNKEKTAKPAKEKKSKPVSDEKKPGKEKSGTVGRILKLLPTVAETAGALKRKIRIDHLVLTVIWGAEDAAAAALGYGKANALLGMIWPLLDNNFKVKKCEWNVDVDYGRSEPEFTADAVITITIGQLISFIFHYGAKLLMNWSRSGKSSAKKQEA